MSWEKLKHFKPDSKVDRWGDASKMSLDLLQRLDLFRASINMPVIVTSGFRSGDTGQHGKGLAVDVVAPDWKGTLLDLYFEAERFGFTGIGLYRDWVYRGKPVYGLHVDVRDPVDGRASRWLCIREGAELIKEPINLLKLPQKYLSLTADTLYDNHII